MITFLYGIIKFIIIVIINVYLLTYTKMDRY